MRINTRGIWADRVARWVNSGLTAREFSAEEGINASTLTHWKWRLGTEAVERPGVPALGFVEVVAPFVAAGSGSAAGGGGMASCERRRGDRVDVVLARGTRLRVPPGVDADWLGQLVHALEGR